MAVNDDLNRLAQDAVVYLTQQLTGQSSGSMVVYRGRLHQALTGNWVFNTSVGTNGVAAIILGPESGTWNSNDGPAGGIVVTVNFAFATFGGGLDVRGNPLPPGQQIVETVTLTDVIPADLAE